MGIIDYQTTWVARRTLYEVSRVTVQQQPRETKPCELKIEDPAKPKAYTLTGIIYLKPTSHAMLNTPKHGEKDWGVLRKDKKQQWL